MMDEPSIRVKLDDGDELIMQILVVRRKHGRSLAVRTDFTMDEGPLNAASEWAALRHIILGDRI